MRNYAKCRGKFFFLLSLVSRCIVVNRFPSSFCKAHDAHYDALLCGKINFSFFVEVNEMSSCPLERPESETRQRQSSSRLEAE